MQKLLWIVQENLYNEDGYARFIEALERLDCDYQVVKVVPIFNKIIPVDFDSRVDDLETAEDPIKDNSRPMIIMGANTLNHISQERLWFPGTFHNSNHHYSKWKENWGDNLLNPDSVIESVQNIIVPNEWNNLFVRPTEDTKSISGTVMDSETFQLWREQICRLKIEEDIKTINRETEIVISSVKKIYNECRVFMFNGKVVTASMYKAGNRVMGNPIVDDRYTDFAQRMADIWSPAIGFVIDICDTPNGLKIIEVNNFNSSGFYACDTMKIVNAIEEWWDEIDLKPWCPMAGTNKGINL